MVLQDGQGIAGEVFADQAIPCKTVIIYPVNVGLHV